MILAVDRYGYMCVCCRKHADKTLVVRKGGKATCLQVIISGSVAMYESEVERRAETKGRRISVAQVGCGWARHAPAMHL